VTPAVPHCRHAACRGYVLDVKVPFDSGEDRGEIVTFLFCSASGLAQALKAGQNRDQALRLAHAPSAISHHPKRCSRAY